MTCFGSKYDQKIHRAFEQNDAYVGRKLLIRPTTPMMDKIVHETTLGNNSKLKGVMKRLLDKDSELFFTY